MVLCIKEREEEEKLMSYKAIVSKISVYPHPDSKYTNIICGKVKGSTVVVGKDTQDQQLGVLFTADGCLSHEFCIANKLYRKLPNGDPGGGYLGENRRIKAEKFGGVKSDGLWLPLACLNFLAKGNITFKDGDEVDTFGGHQFCQKYYTPATLRQMQRNKAKSGNVYTLKDRLEVKFPEHFDTAQLRNNIDKLLDGSHIIASEKLEGTSHRSSHLKVKEYKYTPFQKFLHKYFGGALRFLHIFLEPKRTEKWDFLTGSRHVVLQPEQNGYHGSNAFRFDVSKKFQHKLNKGEVIYGEIVGYLPGGGAIMPAVDTTKMKDKEFTKEYGKRMEYKYGCQPRELKFFVYRVSMVNTDGIEVDMSWNQVKQRCLELGLDHVPELAQIVYKEEDYGGEEAGKKWLTALFEKLSSGKSTLDASHIREGICVRVENEKGTYIYKNKSFEYKVLSGITKADINYVDIEEIS